MALESGVKASDVRRLFEEEEEEQNSRQPQQK